MQKTKEQLTKEIAVLQSQVNAWSANDEERRSTLSGLLESYEYSNNQYSTYNSPKKIKVQNWLGIAFLIGELKADADYACCLQAREDLKSENQILKQKIMDLESTPKT